MFAGGTQSGKTLGGIVDDIIQCCDEDAIPEHLKPFKYWQPPFKCRVVTPSFGHTLDQFQEKVRDWVPRHQLKGGRWESAYSRSDYTLHFENDSYIQFLSGDQDVSKHAGWTGDRVHFDEEPPGDHGRKLYIENKARVAVREGQVMFTMTPTEGITWTGDEVWEKRGEPNYFGIQVDMDDNPTLTENAKQIVLDGLSKEERAARKSGEFVYLKGKVYPEFDYDLHVVQTPDPEHVNSQDVIICIDPGLTMTAVTWTCFDSDNIALVFDELYTENTNIETITQQIKTMNHMWKIKDPYYIIDPTSQNRSQATSSTDMVGIDQVFFQHDIFPIYAHNDVDPGIFQIKRRLQSDPPALLVSEDCSKLLWELKRYRYHEIDTPSGRKIVPVKKDDHGPDCIRYTCAERFWGVEPDFKKRRKQSTYGFQVPYKEERFYQEVGPMGAMS